MADRGIASRREADAFIAAGKVKVNGKPAVVGQQVNETDEISVDGLDKQKKIYLAYYKGRGIITHSPGANETDIKTQLSARSDLGGASPVGRLDKDSEGLMILSNDGRITGPLLDPNAKHEKEYEVSVDKPTKGSFLKRLENGVNIEGYTTKPAKAKRVSDTRFSLTLTEGKKHQIRRMCAALGYQVQNLKRVRIMTIELGKLKPNQYRKITGAELKKFLASLQII